MDTLPIIAGILIQLAGTVEVLATLLKNVQKRQTQLSVLHVIVLGNLAAIKQAMSNVLRKKELF
jgi:hypothetical protein